MLLQLLTDIYRCSKKLTTGRYNYVVCEAHSTYWGASPYRKILQSTKVERILFDLVCGQWGLDYFSNKTRLQRILRLLMKTSIEILDFKKMIWSVLMDFWSFPEL